MQLPKAKSLANRIYELADMVYKREKRLKEESIADLGYIKQYAMELCKTREGTQ